MKRVLIVDDDEALLSVLITALKRGGYEAFAALDGRAGLQMARKHLPDLVLCDVEMPKMTGRELLTALRNDPDTATIPFILMTGQPDHTSMRQGMRMGADDYLAKPFPAAEMLEAIQTRLQRHQQTRDLAGAKEAQIRDMLSTVLPHELLTPLTGIIGLAEIMTMNYETLPPSEILEMANGIQQSGHRLLRSVQNYLLHMDLDRLTLDPERRKTFPPGRLDSIRPVIETAAQICAQRFARPNDLLIEIAGQSVAMAEDWFKKIVEELVDNAFRYSKPGTPVLVKTRVPSGGFHLSVQDHGRGMTPEQIAKTGAFRQFDRPRYEQQGLGLGLVTTQRLVEMHGGSLTIQSVIEDGTTAEVWLPAPFKEVQSGSPHRESS